MAEKKTKVGRPKIFGQILLSSKRKRRARVFPTLSEISTIVPQITNEDPHEPQTTGQQSENHVNNQTERSTLLTIFLSHKSSLLSNISWECQLSYEYGR